MGHLKNGLRIALRLFYAEIRPFLGFGVRKLDFKVKMGHLKNGLRIALRIFYAEIRPFLGFGVGNWILRALKRNSEASFGKLLSGLGDFFSFFLEKMPKLSK